MSCKKKSNRNEEEHLKSGTRTYKKKEKKNTELFNSGRQREENKWKV